ncbi:19863_t:CDS:2, partial [Dentiscutata erythropus]
MATTVSGIAELCKVHDVDILETMIKSEVHKKVVCSLDQQLPTWCNQIDTVYVVN